jgi:hypothetical protein
MKPIIAVAAMVGLGLLGCQKGPDDIQGGVAHRGRYNGIGIYEPGQMWTQLVVKSSSKDATAPHLSDDDHIIVVVDSSTGEVRQCGNMSGYCIGMSPWATPLTRSQIAPVPVAKHADQLTQEAAAAPKPDGSKPGVR